VTIVHEDSFIATPDVIPDYANPRYEIHHRSLFVFLLAHVATIHHPAPDPAPDRPSQFQRTLDGCAQNRHQDWWRV